MEFAALLEAVHRELRPLDDIPGRRADQAAGAARQRLRATGVSVPGDRRAVEVVREDRRGRDAREAMSPADDRRLGRQDRGGGRIAADEPPGPESGASARTAEPDFRQESPDARRVDSPAPAEGLDGRAAGSPPQEVPSAAQPAAATAARGGGGAPQTGSGPPEAEAVGQFTGGRLSGPVGGTVPQASPADAGFSAVSAGPTGAQTAGTGVRPAPQGGPTASGAAEAASRQPGEGSPFRTVFEASSRARGGVGRAGGSAQPEGKAAGEVDLRENGAIERLARVVRSQAGARNGKLVLHLDPPELGRVRVDVRLHEGALSVTLEAEREAGLQAVRDHLEELRQALGRQGLQVDRLDVELRAPATRDGSDAGGSGDQGTGRQEPPPQGQPGSADPRDSTGGSPSGEPREGMGFGRMENEVGEWTRPAESGVDLVA